MTPRRSLRALIVVTVIAALMALSAGIASARCVTAGANGKKETICGLP